MRKAVIEGSAPRLEEQPIRYSLRQYEGNNYVNLEVAVGHLTQTVMILAPHSIGLTRAVSQKLGLPLNFEGEVIIGRGK
jgi:hypothetical protein